MKTDLSVVSWSDSEALISASRPICDQGMRVREHFWINQSGLINHESFFPEILQFVRLLIKTIFFSTISFKFLFSIFFPTFRFHPVEKLVQV